MRHTSCVARWALLAAVISVAAPALAGEDASLPLNPDAETGTGENAPGVRRGIAFLSSNVGGTLPLDEICDFVETCRMNLVVVDFAWITSHWGRTDLKAIDVLARRLKERGVEVAVMYRPRVLAPSDAAVHYARDENAKTADDHNHLCFAHEDSVKWGAEWGARLLEALPSVDRVILYNLGAACRCERCRGAGAERHTARFLERCRTDWAAVRPAVKIGHVGTAAEYAEEVDFICPFLPVNREGDSPPDAAALLAKAMALRPHAAGRPVVPLAKVCWAAETNNTTQDVTRVIEECDRARAGFILWYYDWIFHSRQRRYDPEPIVSALGGDWGKVSAYFRAAGAGAHGRAGDKRYTSEQIRKTESEVFFGRLGKPERGYHQFSALWALVEKAKTGGAATRDQIVSRAVEIVQDRRRPADQRWQCCYVLSDVGDERGVPVLARVLLEDKSEIVRSVAACALGAFGSAQARNALEQAAKRERSPRVLDAVKKALSGEDRKGEYRKKEAGDTSPGAQTTAAPDLAFPYDQTRLEKLPWPHQPHRLGAAEVDQLNRRVWVINDFPLYQADDEGNWRYFHGGLDIVLENGTKIYAMKDGWVKAVRGSSVVIADSEDGTPSYGWEYSHLGNLRVKVGDFVKKGTLIGEVDFHGLPHIHLAKVFSQANYWGDWHYVCMPNGHFTYVDDEPPVIGKPFYFFRNNSDTVIQPRPSGEVVLSGDVDVVVAMREAGLYARSKQNGFGDRLSVARIRYEIRPVATGGSGKRRCASFDFRKISVKKGRKGYDAGEYGTELAKVVYRHWTLFEPERPSGDKTFSYYTITNCPERGSRPELAFGDADYCWPTAALDERGEPVFPDGEYDITVTADDFAGNSSSEVMRVAVANGASKGPAGVPRPQAAGRTGPGE